jgi:hypothetical protein
MNLLRFSEDKIYFRKSKIRFYHITQHSHKGSGLDLLRPVAQQAAMGALGVGQSHRIPGIHLRPTRVWARVRSRSGAVSPM